MPKCRNAEMPKCRNAEMPKCRNAGNFRLSSLFAIPTRASPVHPPRMADSTIDVRYVANLARINLSDEEVTRFGSQLQGVMKHIAKLSEVDVEGIEPTSHASSLSNKVRQDLPVESLPAEGFLQNTPDQANGMLRVPKVVDA
ncbi:MAG: aspartyl-tRNA(Asn)/glutamyl-tRNA(Gln) amidotransferase subunit C [Granulosicoccus sp.]|jgi:aspartyl-tRNA(Asn)/glutamyl-tRNA(Gln) amidotransferase subunit C